MIDHLKRLNDLDIVLSKMDNDALNQLYLRVFQTADGEMVLQDLANRVYVYESTGDLGNDVTSFREGMRAMWLSIQSRLQSAIAPKQKEQENG